MNIKSTNTNPTDDSLTNNEQSLKHSLQEHLDSQVDNLDYTVTSKLNAARHRAMSGDGRKNSTNRAPNAWFNWTTAAGSTAVLAIAVVLGLQFNSLNTPQPTDAVGQISQQALIEDLNLLNSSDDIEFYQSVEFLEWMASHSG